MDAYMLNPRQTRDISDILLDTRGRLRVVEATTLAATTPTERMMFGVRHGVNSFPTTELCAFLRQQIGGRSAIEIGAGHGVLGKALGIPATDNRQQEDPAMAAHYARLGQPTVRYGDHLEKLDATSALAKYKPEVVIACWVTHRFNPSQPDAGGSVTGVDEVEVIRGCMEYIFVGNAHVHRHKPIWALPHQKRTPPWLYSRAVNGSADFVATWNAEHIG